MASDEHGALRRLVDKDEIVDLVHRYSYCVDHRLYDEVAELFTEDCVVDYGPAFAPPVRGRGALRKMFGHPGGGFAATSHHNANVLVTFEDDDLQLDELDFFTSKSLVVDPPSQGAHRSRSGALLRSRSYCGSSDQAAVNLTQRRGGGRRRD